MRTIDAYQSMDGTIRTSERAALAADDAGELNAVRKCADRNYMPSIVIRSDSGQTKRLAISWRGVCASIAALLTDSEVML